MDYFINFPAAHSKEQKIIMNFFNTGAKEIWVACGSKFGKTLSASVGILQPFVNTFQGHFTWIAPIYSQSKIGFDYCKRLLPVEQKFIKFNESSLSIKIKQRDSELCYFHGSNYLSIEGNRNHGAVLDEAAKLKQEVYNSTRTTLTQTKGPLIAISTPFGKNWFFKEWFNAKLEMDYCLKKGVIPERIAITAPTTANPFVAQSEIDFLKKKLPARLFKQYVKALFIDDSDVFTGFERCFTGDLIEFENEEFQTWIHPDAKKYSVCVGADWAKMNDYCVFTALGFANGKFILLGYMRFNKELYRIAVKYLVEFCKNFMEVLLLFHDKTGVGNAVDEMLDETNLPIEGIVFNNSNKCDMVNELILVLENIDILLPNISEIKTEFTTYDVNTSSNGKFIYGAKDGCHDDIVSSLILALSAAKIMLSTKDITIHTF